MKKIFLALIAAAAVGCGTGNSASSMHVAATLGESSDIASDEAVEFVREHFLTLYPGSGFLTSNVTIVGNAKICYARSECWPVKKIDGKLIDVALEVAESLVPARVEFDHHQDLSRQDALWEQRSYAIDLEGAAKLADVLRYIEGYSRWNPYHTKIAPRTLVSFGDGQWGTGYYHADGEWHVALDLAIRFETPAYLQEIYDGLTGNVLKSGADGVRANPLFDGQYIILSPWAVFPSSVKKDGVVVSSKLGGTVLPH